ncbi:MAG: hypothetical protein HZA20_00645 [Nitrospirae bacterium]|nr:hypothetical protein [Nitrospirota bacterium]
MWKKRFFRFSVSLLVVAALASACAHTPALRAKRELPDRIMGRDEVLEFSAHSNVRAVAEVKFFKDGQPVVDGTAAIYIENPGRARVRVYRFGMPVLDALYNSGHVEGVPDVEQRLYGEVFPALISAVFWHSEMNDADFGIERESYVFSTPDRRVVLSQSSLMPVLQAIRTSRGAVVISYGPPALFADGDAFPESLHIQSSSFSLKATINKLAYDVRLEPDTFGVVAP